MAQSDTPDRVASWLATLDVQNTLIPDLDDPQGSLKEREEPVTPLRSRNAPYIPDEASPMSTVFSRDSIFDGPEDTGLGAEPGTSNRADLFSESATTVDEEESTRDAYSEAQQEDKDALTFEQALDPSCAASITSSEPSGETSTEIAPNANANADTDVYLDPHSIDAAQPRLVWIASCLQCTSAGLPCSRTPPACSRCKRSGRGDVCLLHRRKLAEERVPGDIVANTTPVLLKVKGEDSQIWGRKVVLCQEVSSVPVFLFMIWCFDRLRIEVC